MGRRNLRDAKFAKTDLCVIKEFIVTGVLKHARVVDDTEVVVDCGDIVGHLYNYRDMDEPGHPVKMRSEITYSDGSDTLPFGRTWDIPGTEVVSKVMYFYSAVCHYASAREEFNHL